MCKYCNTEYKTDNRTRYYCFKNLCVEQYRKDRKEKIKKTNFDKYGCWYTQTKKFKNKIKETCLEKYGVEHVSKINDIKEKKKETCLKHYGYDNPSKVKKIQEKKKETCLEKYGVEYSVQNDNIKNSIKQTHLEKYGKNYLKTTDFKQKRKEVMIEKYGVEYSLQNEKIFNQVQNKRFIFKIYILPSGKEVRVQGYENIYLNEYFKNGSVEDDIIIHPKQIDIGKIFYINNNDNKKHRYYPDFYIKSTNTIIEVKCEYTYNKELNKNLLKEKSCKHNGYNFEFKIY